MKSSRIHPLLVFVTGAVPGLGKSSSASRLAGWFAESGKDVELFEEEQILERDEFAGQIEEWRSTGSVSEDSLLQCASAYLAWCLRRDADVYVLDSLFPYLPSLLAWGWSDSDVLKLFSQLLARMDGFDVIEIHLCGDARLSLHRASEREGDGWLARFMQKIGSYVDIQREVRTADDVVAYLEDAAARSRHLLLQAPWPVHFIDVDVGSEATIGAALSVLDGSHGPQRL